MDDDGDNFGTMPAWLDAPTVSTDEPCPQPSQEHFFLTEGNEPDAIESACLAAARDQSVFTRGGSYAQITPSPKPEKDAPIQHAEGAPIVRSLTRLGMICPIGRNLQFEKYDGRIKANKRVKIPDRVLGAVHDSGGCGTARHLVGLSSSPFFRPDGSLVELPGWDESTGIYLHARIGDFLPMPQSPSQDESIAALGRVREELLSDYPWEHSVHESAWISALVTVLVRPALGRNNTPLFLIDANIRGAGKSMLCDLISIIANGRTASRMAWTRNDEELDKRIVSILLSGEPMVLFDNVLGSFGSPTLDALLTSSGYYQGRLLGRNDGEASPRIPVRLTVFCSSNNATITGDLDRRTIHVRLNSPLEDPGTRTGFRHPALIPWAIENRRELLRDALTAIRGWYAAGGPEEPELSAFGSFEKWGSVVRSVLIWLGCDDPVITVGELAKEDGDKPLLIALLAALAEGEKLRTNEIVRRIANNPETASLLEAKGIVVDGAINYTKAGLVFGKLRGRVVYNQRLERRQYLGDTIWTRTWI